jgi:asparagine synthase (glutamine-hydrolysing)
MCGIAGLWTLRVGEVADLQTVVHGMADTLRHRGPDDYGIWVDTSNGLALGHTRLSIIDLSARAKQPMVGPSGQTRIVFNGEIYNYRERRRGLEAGGVKFRTESDTEVILALYERFGLDCLHALGGMFAFALWDASARRLLLARDRLGKKPLYYSCHGGNLYFGSEIKAVLAGLPLSPTVDQEALDEYLSFGFVSGERTIYKEIKEVPPGHVLIAASPSALRMQVYWQPQWLPKRVLSISDAVNEAEALLTEAVSHRLRADVPAGIFLSGGIDSGLITAIASKSLGSQCLTFSVGFEDGSFDERPLAQQVAQRYNTTHHEVLLQPEIVSLLPKMAQQYDEPFGDPSAIPSFTIAAYARQFVKVVLNGDGGDELFAGYRRHLAAAVRAKIKRVVPMALTQWTAERILQCLPEPTSFRTAYAFSHRFLQGLSGSNAERMLAWYSIGFTPVEKSAMCRHVFPARHGLELLETLLNSYKLLNDLDRATAVDLAWVLPGDLLVKMDMATMAYGLEARSPFLDYKLVEWANTLPQSVRLPGLSTKPLLRKLAHRYLPEAVVQAPKRGFEVPLHYWLEHELREMRDDLILAPNGIVLTLFHRAKIEQLLSAPHHEPHRWARLVWLLLMLAAWERYAVSTAKTAA